MKKKTIILIILLLFNINQVKADTCTKDSATQIAKIVYRESGADTLPSKEENFFRRLNVASVALNNASRKKGSNWYEKIYNLDSVYGNYKNYKDTPYTTLVSSEKQGELLYISELVLTGKYNLPSNMYLQAEPEIVNKYGKVWTNIGSIYFGYEGSTLSSKDVFGNKLSSNTVSYFKNKAKSLMLSDYSSYTPNNVCTDKINNNSSNTNNKEEINNNSNNTTNNKDEVNNNSTNTNNKKDEVNNNSNNTNNKDEVNSDSSIEMIEVCKNPDVLRVIYFIKIIIDIIKIIIPIGLIIIGSIDLTKSIINNDDKDNNKNLKLFGKRLIYAIIVFLVPWIIEVIISLLGGTLGEDNWTECITNANSETIEELERNQK